MDLIIRWIRAVSGSKNPWHQHRCVCDAFIERPPLFSSSHTSRWHWDTPAPGSARSEQGVASTGTGRPGGSSAQVKPPGTQRTPEGSTLVSWTVANAGAKQKNPFSCQPVLSEFPDIGPHCSTLIQFPLSSPCNDPAHLMSSRGLPLTVSSRLAIIVDK